MHLLGERNPFDPVNASISDLVKHRGEATKVNFSRGISWHLITEGTQRQFLANGTTDAVVASTHTWTLANGAFATTDVGGKLVVRGTVSNDGEYNITSRTSATVIVTDGIQVNETFSATAVFIVVPPGTLDGSWTIEASNDYQPIVQAGVPTIPVPVEHWADVTSQFRDADGNLIATVAHGTASTRSQLVQAAPIAARHIRASFTATAGTGVARAFLGGSTL